MEDVTIVPSRNREIEALFDADSVVAVERRFDETTTAPGLFDGESAAVARAVDARRREFAFGRDVARIALDELGRDAVPIPVGPNRSPTWPAGVSGSISHTEGYCLAVVCPSDGRLSIGVDAELVGRVGPDVFDVVATPGELDALGEVVGPTMAGVLVFSAKEAFYKAQFQLTAEWVGFEDVVVVVDDHDDSGPTRGTARLDPVTDVAHLSRRIRQPITARWWSDRRMVIVGATVATI